MEDDQYSSDEDSDEDSQEIIDVIGQGVLNEVCQMRGDEDSRRYRVFQHYLRTSGNNDKKKAKKHFHTDKDGDKGQAHLSFSSDSEYCIDETHVEKKKSMKSALQRKLSFAKEEKINKVAETKPLTHK